MGKTKKVILNVSISTVSQIINLALGLILPRIILTSWGSEYNGLINSVLTIMRYLTLLEAGISVSTLQAFYKSLSHNDNEQTSIIIKTSQAYYYRVSIVYAIIVILISFVYPLFLKTEISYWEIVWVIILQGCTGIINFIFRASYQQLLNAEGKYYIISIITTVTNVLTYAAKIIAITVFNNIIVMQLLGVAIVIIQVVIYAIYFHKKYGWINKKVKTDMSLLENRKYYLFQQLCSLIFNSTDTILLSVFCGLKVASVYTVYNMIYGALATVIGIVRSSTNFVLGQSFHEDSNKFRTVYKTYSAMQITVGSILSSVGIILIIPFISIYTAGVTDIDYIKYFAAILFSVNFMLDCSRGASLAGANVAGKAPNTLWRYALEAFINLGVSLALIRFMKMEGVLIGTLAAGLWRTVDSIVYFNKKVINSGSFKEFIFVFINFALFGIFAVLGKMNLLSVNGYLGFAVWGGIITVIMMIVFGAVFVLMNTAGIKSFLRVIRHK